MAEDKGIWALYLAYFVWWLQECVLSIRDDIVSRIELELWAWII